MTKRQEIEIIILADGEVQLKVLGTPGTGCLEMTKSLEKALGTVVFQEKTGEYYQQETGQTVQVDKGRS